MGREGLLALLFAPCGEKRIALHIVTQAFVVVLTLAVKRSKNTQESRNVTLPHIA